MNNNGLQLSELALQLLTIAWAVEDVPNKKLLEELNRQNTVYLEKIIDNQNQILNKLAELG